MKRILCLVLGSAFLLIFSTSGFSAPVYSADDFREKISLVELMPTPAMAPATAESLPEIFVATDVLKAYGFAPAMASINSGFTATIFARSGLLVDPGWHRQSRFHFLSTNLTAGNFTRSWQVETNLVFLPTKLKIDPGRSRN